MVADPKPHPAPGPADPSPPGPTSPIPPQPIPLPPKPPVPLAPLISQTFSLQHETESLVVKALS